LPASRWETRGPRAVSRPFLALLVLVMLGAAAVLLALFDPTVVRFYPLCPFHALTGFDCPGCGSLRGLHQLLHGHLVAAFRLNPLMVLALPFEAYALASWALGHLTGRRLPGVFLRPAWIWTVLVAILAFWVFRNSPFYPFS
jgi:hypothetical protein